NFRGSDAGNIGFGMLDAINCGIAVAMCSLDGPVMKRMISQSNRIEVCARLRRAGAMVTYSIQAEYSEGNYVDVFHNTEAASDGGYFIGAEYALNLAKVDGGMVNTAILKNGKLYRYHKRSKNADSGSSAYKLFFLEP